MIFPARSTLFDAENVFRLLSDGVPRSMEENVPQKNHCRSLSDNKQRGLYKCTCMPLCAYGVPLVHLWCGYGAPLVRQWTATFVVIHARLNLQ